MNDKYYTLFEYLNRPAGAKLGWNVAVAANKQNIKPIVKEISNPKYKGQVNAYPHWFLNQYFNNKTEPKLPF